MSHLNPIDSISTIVNRGQHAGAVTECVNYQHAGSLVTDRAFIQQFLGHNKQSFWKTSRNRGDFQKNSPVFCLLVPFAWCYVLRPSLVYATLAALHLQINAKRDQNQVIFNLQAEFLTLDYKKRVYSSVTVRTRGARWHFVHFSNILKLLNFTVNPHTLPRHAATSANVPFPLFFMLLC